MTRQWYVAYWRILITSKLCAHPLAFSYRPRAKHDDNGRTYTPPVFRSLSTATIRGTGSTFGSRESCQEEQPLTRRRHACSKYAFEIGSAHIQSLFFLKKKTSTRLLGVFSSEKLLMPPRRATRTRSIS